ncbi:hypothetical protein FGU65_02120 [Methanoculleus sp. FWC-SCC1]|uniref:Uncharacterized protein n=1 Tax=Methanoculleus frigidifontis TaxID=2584085 RepID=A0ABT8M6Z8_9EURY|nr:hypothetical protein [Methanoculleus sp. FWC-SCC1]
MLSGWFAFAERYPTVLQNYFATVTNADRYPEHGFLSLCQCMEIYHRQAPQFCDAVTDPEVHAERIAVVTEALKADGRLNSDTRRTLVRLLKNLATGRTWRPGYRRLSRFAAATYPCSRTILPGSQRPSS